MADLSDSIEHSNSISEVPVKIINEPTVEAEDRTFIRKTIEFIQTLPGANKDKMVVQTNTSFPSRYVLMVSNLPEMNLSDFDSIKTLAPRLRSIKLSLKDNWIKVDMWKHGATTRKAKRKVTSNASRPWNLKTIGKQDHEMLKRILNGFSNLPSLPCQFHLDVVSEPPNYYYLHITSNDTINIQEISDFNHEYRAFVKNIQFNYPNGTIKLKIERASASTSEVVSNKRRHLVYKRSN